MQTQLMNYLTKVIQQVSKCQSFCLVSCLAFGTTCLSANENFLTQLTANKVLTFIVNYLFVTKLLIE